MTPYFLNLSPLECTCGNSTLHLEPSMFGVRPLVRIWWQSCLTFVDSGWSCLLTPWLRRCWPHSPLVFPFFDIFWPLKMTLQLHQSSFSGSLVSLMKQLMGTNALSLYYYYKNLLLLVLGVWPTQGMRIPLSPVNKNVISTINRLELFSDVCLCETLQITMHSTQYIMTTGKQ